MEDWLYGEGEDASREIYVEKLGELSATIEGPIHKRQREQQAAANTDGDREEMAVDGENGTMKN